MRLTDWLAQCSILVMLLETARRESCFYKTQEQLQTVPESSQADSVCVVIHTSAVFVCLYDGDNKVPSVVVVVECPHLIRIAFEFEHAYRICSFASYFVSHTRRRLRLLLTILRDHSLDAAIYHRTRRCRCTCLRYRFRLGRASQIGRGVARAGPADSAASGSRRR